MRTVRPKRTKKTAFVPRGLFGAIAGVAVIPLCACGGQVSPQLATVAAMAFDGGQQNRDAGSDVEVFSVGAAAFDAVAISAFDAGDGPCNCVGAIAFDASPDAVFDVATSAFDASPDVGFIVAANGFDASTDAAGDATNDAADASGADASFTVAAHAFHGKA